MKDPTMLLSHTFKDQSDFRRDGFDLKDNILQAPINVQSSTAYCSAVSGYAAAWFNFLDPGIPRPLGAGWAPAMRGRSLSIAKIEETIMTCFRTEKAMAHAVLLTCFLIFLSLFVMLPNGADAAQRSFDDTAAASLAATPVTSQHGY